MGTTEVTYVTNHYGISEEQLHEILEGEKNKFNEVIKELEDTNKSYKKNIDNQRIEINNLKNDIEILEIKYKNQINNMEKEYEIDMKEKNKEIKKLSEQLTKTKDRLKAAWNSYNIAKKKNEELEKQLGLEKQKSEEYLKKWIQTKNELIEQKKENIELKEEISVKNEIIDFLEGELRELTGRYEQQKEDFEKFDKTVNGLKNDVSELKRTNEGLKGSIDKNNDLMAKMKNDMEKNEKKMEEMNKKMESLNSNMDAMMSMMKQLLSKDQ